MLPCLYLFPFFLSSLSPFFKRVSTPLYLSLFQLRPATERREAAVSRALSATYRRDAARDGQAERGELELRVQAFPATVEQGRQGKDNKMESIV